MVRRPRQTIQATTIRQKEEYTSERKATERGASKRCKPGISWSIREPPCGVDNFGSYYHPKCIRPLEAPLRTVRPPWKSVKTKSEKAPFRRRADNGSASAARRPPPVGPCRSVRR